MLQHWEHHPHDVGQRLIEKALIDQETAIMRRVEKAQLRNKKIAVHKAKPRQVVQVHSGHTETKAALEAEVAKLEQSLAKSAEVKTQTNHPTDNSANTPVRSQGLLSSDLNTFLKDTGSVTDTLKIGSAVRKKDTPNAEVHQDNTFVRGSTARAEMQAGLNSLQRAVKVSADSKRQASRGDKQVAQPLAHAKTAADKLATHHEGTQQGVKTLERSAHQALQAGDASAAGHIASLFFF
ncbi:MAG: hypothetical protein ACPIOQ_75510 [Promethearchaeia archaeon]